MPKTFPRAPLPFLASLVAPFAWLYGRPDLFDSYSAGIVLLQLSGDACILHLTKFDFSFAQNGCVPPLCSQCLGSREALLGFQRCLCHSIVAFVSCD